LIFKEGAGGIIGMNECVALASKNTLCMATQAQYVHSIVLNENVRKFNPEELTYVKPIGLSPGVLVTNIENTKTLKEIVSEIKTKKVNFGNGALGLTVLTNWVLKQLGPIDAAMVDFKGTGPVLTNIMGKQIDYAIMPYAVAKNAYAQGQVRIVASLGESEELSRRGVPRLQTMVPNVDDDYTIFGFVMAPNMNRQIVKQHENMLTTLLASPIVRQQLLEQGISPIGDKMQNYTFADIAKSERIKLAKLLEAMPKR
jgi:tripartite-type tricarboxylate transporter receptor subunit TctC